MRLLIVCTVFFLSLSSFSLVLEAGALERSDILVEIISDTRGVLPITTAYGLCDSCRSTYCSGVVRAGRGERYKIMITNNSPERIGLVIAVDGRNIISGERSSGSSSESMYVLLPRGSGTFSGWRAGMNSINRFYFTDAEDSYVGQIGDTSQIGQISIAGFAEKENLYIRNQPFFNEKKDFGGVPSGAKGSEKARTDSSCSPSMIHSSVPGTGYGESEYSPVKTVDYEPENYPSIRYTIRYEWERTPQRFFEAPEKGFVPNPHSSNMRYEDQNRRK
ncbi:MAG: hypothetical protein HQM08_25660 [Candidatus Riflebacteria bacterium]|nr:hypothetical protein [Candidatus Riflebacteria bacterium]